MATIKVAKNYRDLERLYPAKRRIRSVGQNFAFFLLSAVSRVDASREWIRFPYYHHVFDDERDDFGRHLRYMRNHGDFISLDTVVTILEKEEKLGGRYFCTTFDDGFKNCVSNALPILVENECPATFFLPTDYIGCDIYRDSERIERFLEATITYPIPIDFLNWDDCRELLKAGMAIGAHTCSHVALSDLDEEQLRLELVRSRREIEEQLDIDCIHFACPWGIPGRDFRIDVDPAIVKEAGYRSFLTTERGPNCEGTDPFRIRRNNMLAGWGNHYLRYFFSKKS